MQPAGATATVPANISAIMSEPQAADRNEGRRFLGMSGMRVMVIGITIHHGPGSPLGRNCRGGLPGRGGRAYQSVDG